jgi:hypothetical protein
MVVRSVYRSTRNTTLRAMATSLFVRLSPSRFERSHIPETVVFQFENKMGLIKGLAAGA